jgi:hypothetical protein
LPSRAHNGGYQSYHLGPYQNSSSYCLMHRCTGSASSKAATMPFIHQSGSAWTNLITRHFLLLFTIATVAIAATSSIPPPPLLPLPTPLLQALLSSLLSSLPLLLTSLLHSHCCHCHHCHRCSCSCSCSHCCCRCRCPHHCRRHHHHCHCCHRCCCFCHCSFLCCQS